MNFFKKLFHQKSKVETAPGEASALCDLSKGERVEASTPLCDSQGVLVENLLLAQVGRGCMLLPVAASGTHLPVLQDISLATTEAEQSSLLVLLFRGQEPRPSMNHYLGAYRINGFPAAPGGTIVGRLRVVVLQGSDGPAIWIAAWDVQEKQLSITAMKERRFTPAEVDTQDFFFYTDPVKEVRGYIAWMRPAALIGYSDQGEWQLPGGLLEGQDQPELPKTPEKHFYPLYAHTRKQTGLELTGLSAPQVITVQPAEENGSVNVTVLYTGSAIGHLTRGILLDPDRPPKFSRVGESAIETIAFWHRRSQEEAARLPAPAEHAIIDPISGTEAGGLNAIFMATAPGQDEPDGLHRHILLRFYSDGLVLELPAAVHQFQEEWPNISNFFQRDSEVEMGRGVYYLKDGLIWFSTQAYYEVMQTGQNHDFVGSWSEEKIILRAEDRDTGAIFGPIEFQRLGSLPPSQPVR